MTNSEEEVRSFGSILEIILNPESFSEDFRSLKARKVAVNPSEKLEFHVNLSSKRIVGVSYYSLSPLLHDIILDEKLIPLIVTQINASESDETLIVLCKILFHLMRIINSNEFAPIMKQGLFEGIRKILIRCDIPEGIHAAIEALTHAVVFDKRWHSKIYFCSNERSWLNNFRFVILEIILGMYQRNDCYQRYVSNKRKFFDAIMAGTEEEELIKEFFTADDESDEKKATFENKIHSKKESSSQAKQKGKLSNNNKRKQNAEHSAKSKKVGKPAEADSDKPDELKTGDSSKASEKEKKPTLPFSVRLEAVCVFQMLENRLDWPVLPETMLSILSEGLILPDGAEEEYLTQKTKELDEKAQKEKEMRMKEMEKVKQAARKKRGKEVRKISGKKNEKKESEQEEAKEEEEEEEEDDDNDNEEDDSDSDVLEDADSYEARGRGVPLTACDVTENMKQLQMTLLTVAKCLHSIQSQTNRRNIEKAPEILFTALLDRLKRLMNFPMKRFYTLAASCVELLFMVMPDSMLLRCLPEVESQISADLLLIEKETSDIIAREKDPTYSSPGWDANWEDNDPYLLRRHRAMPNDLSLAAFVPVMSDFLTGSDYDVASLSFSDAQSYGVTIALPFIVANLNHFAMDPLHAQVEYKRKLPVKPYHYSFTAHRLNHRFGCILSAVIANRKNADVIVLHPFFRNIIQKLSCRFQLRAPLAIGIQMNNHFHSSSLEAVPLMLALTAAAVLMKVSSELPYAFEMGFVSELVKWMVERRNCQYSLIIKAVVSIRETSLIFTLPSRKLRLEQIKPVNSIIEQTKKNPTIDFAFRQNLSRSWSGITYKEKEVCLPACFGMYLSTKQIAKCDTVDFVEDEEEAEKHDNTGAILYSKLEDALEESGLRDVVESLRQKDNVDSFWMIKGTPPTKPRYDIDYGIEGIFSRYNPRLF
ncbi:uncharacterized protein MONOS_6454 [Monocercomonoides exilis]|uniref:uncharacterized protein n=1 Tax=Monocercomonoides exilis TaxID=2049356 RepID=UPI00355937C9|nr:hypothetical protein MONOS_6454 [Monocercomonoides exilis]|eukprot:MONOS_6454.1-p1 / transcript=MONOS_6454.1 / gene=MONOS_6454 / organism=Monocercomonoides_exilis_PA203 / gene_product=unspecified product / transcript_product=unspecified product / location=Mono_scaffold00203:38921-42133(-) / protein_length=933 / sequence_SO=supercontig / SO=protein_coding / is_pseudo=false